VSHLFEIAATLLAGLGLFFVGLKEVSRQLTAMGGSRLRELVTQASSNSVTCWVMSDVAPVYRSRFSRLQVSMWRSRI